MSSSSGLRASRVEVNLEADDESLLQPPPPRRTQYGALCGGSAPMRELYGVLDRLAGSLVSVLIEGESGTGKELVARTIHEQSRVRSGPFVAVNCGALESSLVRSELFGHVRGAFTGAVDGRVGAFEAAEKGTLFLDEIGELPLDLQQVLLRAIETRSIQRVGESATRSVDVRLVSATHRKLEDLVHQGRFREDLYYRLLVVRLCVPPLRRRSADIPELVRHFSDELQLPHFPPQVVAELASRPWPGNVRELKNVMLAYSVLGQLPTPAPSSSGLDAALRASVDLTRPYASQKEQVVAHFLRVYLEQLLEHTQQNQSEAARVSGIDRSRLNKLARKLK